MRIIGGKLRSRMFEAPVGLTARPTADRARVALFNILGSALDGARVLDGFAGSGALSFEAVSRGASMALLFETDEAVAAKLRENGARLGIEEYIDIRQADFLAEAPKLEGTYAFDVVFLDPPYASGLLERAMKTAERLIAPGGVIVAEHRAETEMPDELGALELIRTRRYGAAALSFYRNREES